MLRLPGRLKATNAAALQAEISEVTTTAPILMRSLLERFDGLQRIVDTEWFVSQPTRGRLDGGVGGG
jgi:hypothetical protein